MVEVRRATTTDVTRVKRLLESMQPPPKYGFLWSLFSPTPKGTWIDDVLKFISSKRGLTKQLWVAVENEELVGIACFECYNYSAGATSKMLCFDSFGILPEHRGRGSGRAMLQAIINYATEKHFCEITAQAEEGCEVFWEKMGFSCVDDYSYHLDLPFNEVWKDFLKKHWML